MSTLATILTACVAIGPTVKLNNGNIMPSINLGTCCGSDPRIGMQPWLKAGGRGIDTAWDYEVPETPNGGGELHHDEIDIGEALKQPGAPKREDLFITTKIPAGFGNASDCADPDQLPDIAYNYVVDNLRMLGMKYVDLALVHRPCDYSQHRPKDPVASNNALWKGMQRVLKDGLAKAIGVSNYAVANLQALDMSSAVPSVNQCSMSVKRHDDATIAFCQSKGIVYEAYGALRGCPWTDSDVVSIAKAHNVSVAQICTRFILDRGCILAAGTGSNASTVDDYTNENLDLFNFELSAAEIKTLNSKGIAA